MNKVDLIRELRRIAEVGIVNAKRDIPMLQEAADRLEEMDERITIMLEGAGKVEACAQNTPLYFDHDAYEHRYTGLLEED